MRHILNFLWWAIKYSLLILITFVVVFILVELSKKYSQTQRNLTYTEISIEDLKLW